MAERYAVADGNWSDVATWDGGASLPTTGDTVHAGGFTVTVDQDITVDELTTVAGASAPSSGTFEVQDGWTINANITGGNTDCVTLLAGDHTINGNVSNSSTLYGDGIVKTTSGTFTVNGDVTSIAGVANNTAYGIYCSVGNAVIVGDVQGGTSANNATDYGIYWISAGTLTITGSLNAGGKRGDAVVATNSNAVVTVTGDLNGGNASGAANEPTGALTISSGATAVINGDVFAGVNIRGHGFYIGTNSNATVTGDCTASATCSALHSLDTFTGSVEFSGDTVFTSASNGTVPLQVSRVLIPETDAITYEYRDAALVARSLYTGGIDIGNPATTDVRSGTTFGPASEYTGSLAVPDAQYVNLGVPVDSGVGTLDSVDASGIRAAIGLASANLDAQLSNISSAVVDGVTATGVSSNAVDEIFSTYTISESYASTGVDATPAQIMYMTQQAFTDFNIVGTTINVNKIGSGIAATYSLNDASTPTSRERST